MYNVCKDVITSGRYELSDMLHKLDKIWLQGSLTEQQHTELVQLAKSHADPAMSMDLSARMTALEDRVAALEGDPAPGDYPEYIPGTIAKPGKIYLWDGVAYKCIVPDGATCVWSPADYPNYWEQVK